MIRELTLFLAEHVPLLFHMVGTVATKHVSFCLKEACSLQEFSLTIVQIFLSLSF